MNKINILVRQSNEEINNVDLTHCSISLHRVIRHEVDGL